MSAKKALSAIFLHIPKTGGLTLHDILNRQYAKEETYSCWNVDDLDEIEQLNLIEKEKIRIIKGHIKLEIAEKVPQRMFFFTFLREPIARTISHYEYIKRFEGHSFHKEMKAHNYSLKDLLEGGFIKNLDNCQVRFLSGEHHIPFGEINETHYKKAIQNLENLIYSFGIVEHYDESLLLLQDKLHWRTPFYASRNIAPAKEDQSEYPNHLLLKYNQYDLLLYVYAKEKLLGEIAKKGNEFTARVQRFKKLNKWFGKAAILKRKLFN
ncbi:MAG TPA: sulfotransferase family 2 domain-containing protein [Bacteroidia bacterium]|jgi:hypothetical protein